MPFDRLIAGILLEFLLVNKPSSGSENSEIEKTPNNRQTKKILILINFV